MVKVNISPPRERVVTITIKESEAETLRIVCQYIGGDDETSRRKFFQELDFLLEKKEVNLPDHDEVRANSGEIFFLPRGTDAD